LATLKNRAGDINIILSLKKTDEFPDWIGYDFKITINKQDEEKDFLKLTYSDELYFDNFCELEIPLLCSSLDLLINGKMTDYVFEPVDEKDFRLEIKKEANDFRTNVFLRESRVLDSYDCNSSALVGLQIKITNDDLVNFSSALKKEFDNLFKKLTLEIKK
jgi:hypothetical protein